MARISAMEAATGLYTVLHQITLESEAGKPLSAELLKLAQIALAQADKLRALRELVYAASNDDREPNWKEQAQEADFAHARKLIEEAHDDLSEALENPDAGNDEVRDAAIDMCDALNAAYQRFPADRPGDAAAELASQEVPYERALVMCNMD